MEAKQKGIIQVRVVITGITVSFAVIIAGCFLSAFLMHKEILEIETAGYLTMATLILSGLSGGIVAVLKAQSKILIVSCIIGIGIFLVLLCAGALLFDGTIAGYGQTFLLLIGMNVSAVLVGTNRKGNRKTKRYRIRTG